MNETTVFCLNGGLNSAKKFVIIYDKPILFADCLSIGAETYLYKQKEEQYVTSKRN